MCEVANRKPSSAKESSAVVAKHVTSKTINYF